MTGLLSHGCVLLSFAAASGAGSGDIADDPRFWLQRMNHAIETLNYEGTFVHVTQDKAETMRIVHRVSDGRVSERLVALDGSGREIIRTDDEVRCILQGDRSVLVDRQSPLQAAIPPYRAELEDLYEFKVKGSGRVADRDTRVIEVRPRDEYRYGHRMWLDRETGMPLRTQLLDADGEVIEQILFSSITLSDEIADTDLRQALSDEGFTWYRDDTRPEPTVATAAWQPQRLPDGFQLTLADTENEDGDGVDHYVYSDGLASVSIFVEQARSPAETLQGFSTIGTANAFGTTVEGYQVTVVGEVPPGTVEMIGASLRRRH